MPDPQPVPEIEEVEVEVPALYWYEPHHPHHHHHHHEPKFVDVVVHSHTRFLTKEVNMSTVTIIDGQSDTATLGVTRDASGAVTTDPVATGTAVWSIDNALLSISPSTDTLSAVLTVPAGSSAGTVNVTVTATTVGGVPVTGAGVVTINVPPVGPPVTVDINFSTPA